MWVVSPIILTLLWDASSIKRIRPNRFGARYLLEECYAITQRGGACLSLWDCLNVVLEEWPQVERFLGKQPGVCRRIKKETFRFISAKLHTKTGWASRYDGVEKFVKVQSYDVKNMFA